ncbi:MAG: TetR/AcrR family transcriptional regulator [Wenzhouxiangella sp.]|nr:MAG: TetR/AcrR family transcriptional regulator [Wenzhouxiangella sp.]
MPEPVSLPAAPDSIPADGRTRLLSAAAAEFSRHGFAGASIAAIARAAGVGKSTVFHHFESKEALYLAVIREAAVEFGQTLDTVLSTAEDPATCIATFQHRHLAHLQRNAEVARLVLRELQEPASERCLTLVREVLSPNFQRLVDYLKDAAAAGLIRADVDAAAAALTLLSANVLYFQSREALSELPGQPLADDPEAFASAIADVVFRGLFNRSEHS